ncbi:stress response protein Rds1, putative [Talaromyces stipitatus ATCC 10500]|uniref:Stress response protein Rds1, putative n=1 Tax=Talaromyces stipitatus (strain ATCC 10500 / CBS 375.48 / QM 6759 / NRRL 1006) TaxID=441959 RepID=B8M342_TALSN|nr:stress response protein Rds1, putative [Talaromyces stipitatus ATCC 10500]EED22018.1 stress response protein Rds1, putative [Talaromyces stipitatus ATCC 10500]
MLPRKSIVALLASLSLTSAIPQQATTTTTSTSTASSGSSTSTSSTTTTTTQAAASSSAPATRPGLSSVSHGAYSGSASVTGAVTASSVGTGIVVGGVPPAATTYPADGQLHDPEPAPYVPAGGVGLNTTPVYNVKSDFDFESLALALYQEWIELDLFQYGLEAFSVSDFEDAGLTAEDRALIEFMAIQEIGHATVISNMLGPQAPVQCNYNYPFTNVREFVDFCQKLTRFGEAGVYGYLSHLDSREASQLLLQSITTEARQQLIFRQFEGLFPMPVWFQVGVPQSWAWTLLAPYISSCPTNQTRLAWQNFPALWILNQPNPVRRNATQGFNETLGAGTNTLNSTGISGSDACFNNTDKSNDCNPAISNNRSIPLSYPRRVVNLTWEYPGKPVGPNSSYVTSSTAGSPAFVAWVSQLNVTYSPLNLTSNTSGTTIQPSVETYEGDPAVNGTLFIAITDSDLYLTPFNLTLINEHVVAGPALYQAG